jgi:hypothetical protein
MAQAATKYEKVKTDTWSSKAVPTSKNNLQI